MNRIFCIAVSVSLLATAMFGQANAVLSAREYRIANENRLAQQFIEFLSMPNVASDTPNIVRNADCLIDMMRKSELKPRLLTLTDKTVPPVEIGRAHG